jgi:post-segregation antitoxin (ccd killing protein)
MQMSNKRNLVIYMDDELVTKSKEFGFNLSKTFENHLKHLINTFSIMNSENNNNIAVSGSQGEIRTPVRGSKDIRD